MCGIVGFTGNHQAAPILLDGLSKLEYRGYDSAGIAVRDGEALLHRHTGCGHLGQTGTLAAQRVLHGDLVTAESVIAFAEVVQILFAHALFTSHS